MWGGISREQAIQSYSNRFIINHHAKSGAYSDRKIIYIQNILDAHHYEEHFKPFCSCMSVGLFDTRTNSLNIRLFEHEGGHGKAETTEFFSEAMRLLN